MGHSFGHDVPSDWADKPDSDIIFGLYKNCGFWTHDEAAILWECAARSRGQWLDIGSHTGWTTAHVLSSGSRCIGVDPMYTNPMFRERASYNLAPFKQNHRWALVEYTSAEYFERCSWMFNGVVIDGDHEPGMPLADAQSATRHLLTNGVILFHDFIGRPVREAVEWLMNNGFQARVYETPHMVAACWKGDFLPPDHVSDSNLPNLRERCPEFPWNRTV